MPDQQTASRHGVWRRLVSRELVILAGILLVGAVLRGLYLREILAGPAFYHPAAIDSDYHDDWARGLLTGNWEETNSSRELRIGDVPYFRPPGYPYFLALVYAATGGSYLAARVVQMSIGLLTCVLAYVFGKRWFGPAVGLIAAGFASVYWVFIYYEAELHAPFLLVFLGLALLSVLAGWVEGTGFLRCAVAGVVLGLFAVVRPNILVFVPFVLGWGWWVAGGKPNVARFARAAAGFLLGTGVVIAPVTIRNYLVSGEWVLISANGGVVLMIGNNEEANSVNLAAIPGLEKLAGRCGWTSYDYPEIVEALERKLGRPLTYSQASRYFAGQALAYIRTHPLDWLRLTLKKIAVLCGPIEFDSNKEPYHARQDSALLGRLPGGFAWALSLGVLGTVLLLRDVRQARRHTPPQLDPSVTRCQVTVLMLLYVGSYAASLLPFSIATRYRLPIVAVLFLLGAYGVYRVVQFAVGRDLRKAALCAGGWLGLFALAATSFVGTEPSRARWHSYLGNAYMRNDQLDRAIEHFQTAVRLKPYDGYARYALGAVLLESGRTNQALSHLTEAVALRPRSGMMHSSLGVALAKQGRTAEGVAHLIEALRRRPGYPEALENLGIARMREGNLDEAIEHFQALVRLKPRRAAAQDHLGRALARRGKIAQAVEHYAEALRLQPDSVAVHDNLGSALVRLNRTGEAVDHFRQAARLDPNRAEVHQKLGVSLLSLKRIDQAIPCLLKAVQLEPDSIGARHDLGWALVRAGRMPEAAAQFAKVVRLDPRHTRAHNSLAWILAAYAEPGLTGLGNAVELAERACELTDHKDPTTLDTLAAAYAAAGRFGEAVATAKQAMALASASGRKQLADRIRNRLQLYEAGRPYREHPATTVPASP